METKKKRYCTPSSKMVIMKFDTAMLIGSGGDGTPGDNAEVHSRDFDNWADSYDMIWGD